MAQGSRQEVNQDQEVARRRRGLNPEGLAEILSQGQWPWDLLILMASGTLFFANREGSDSGKCEFTLRG